MGRLLARGVDARYMMTAGLVTLGIGSYWMSHNESGHQPLAGRLAARGCHRGALDALRAAQCRGLPLHPKELRGAAVGLLALLRNEGGSVGTSMAQTIEERREQFHLLRLGENLDVLNPAVNSFISDANPVYAQQTSDPVAAKLMALQSLDDLRQQQASSLAYFDTFVEFAAVSFALVFFVFLMRRSVAEKGAHVGAE